MGEGQERRAFGDDPSARGLRSGPSDDLPDHMKEIRFVVQQPPGPTSQFVEVEDERGRSVNVGEWRERQDGLWELVLIVGAYGDRCTFR